MSNLGKTKKKSNNKTNRGAGINTPMLGLPNSTDISNNNTTVNSLKKSPTQSNVDTFEELEQKTIELTAKLNEIKSNMEQEKNLLMEETYQLNENITEKGFEISSLSMENKNLISELKDIKSTLDNKLKIGKIFLVKMEKLKKEEANLKKLIEVVKKEKELAEKSQNIAINDYNRMRNIAENNDPEKQGLLESELETLLENKKSLENENTYLKKIIKQHKLCPKIKQNLLSKLNVITNSYEFEIKKTNMLESNLVNLEEKKEKIKNDKIKKENEEKMNERNRSISYCSDLRKKVLEKMDKKNSEKNLVPQRTALHVSNICNNIIDQNRKKYENIKNINNSDYKLKQQTLFTDIEQMQLATIIPTSYLNEFKERFDSVENQRYELVDKIKTNQNRHSNMLNSVKIKLNYTELRKKEQKMLMVDLNSNLAKQNVNITKLKTDINKITKELNTWKKLLKAKTNEGNRLNKYINDIKKNKNSEDYQSSGESRRVIKPKKKREFNLEEQNNISLVYNMGQ